MIVNLFLPICVVGTAGFCPNCVLRHCTLHIVLISVLVFVLILVSVSGKSPNVLRAAKAARKNKLDKIITFSGHSSNNPLRKLGDINFWINSKSYNQVDCKLFKFKTLSMVFHKQSMGKGTGEPLNSKNSEWIYPPPNSIVETIMNKVCNY